MRITALRKLIIQKNREAKQYNSPITFAKYAKLKREIDKLQEELASLSTVFFTFLKNMVISEPETAQCVEGLYCCICWLNCSSATADLGIGLLNKYASGYLHAFLTLGRACKVQYPCIFFFLLPSLISPDCMQILSYLSLLLYGSSFLLLLHFELTTSAAIFEARPCTFFPPNTC
jgi:hypothetical protein